MLKRLSQDPLRLVLFYAAVGTVSVFLLNAIELALHLALAITDFVDITFGIIFVIGTAWFAYRVFSRRENQLSEAESLSRKRADACNALIEAARITMIAIDRDGRVGYWSPSAAEIFGLAEAEVVGKPLPLSSPWGNRWWEQSSQSRDGFQTQYSCPDGARIDLRVRMAPMHAVDRATVTGWIVVVTDMTLQNRAAQEGRNTQSRLITLSEVGRVLGNADLELPEKLEKASRFLVPALADWCVIDVLDRNGSPYRAALHHADRRLAGIADQLRKSDLTAPWFQERMREVEEKPDGTLRQMVGGDEGGLVPSGDPILEHMASLGIRCSSAILVPIAWRGQLLGCMVLTADQGGRMLTVADLSLARDVGLRIGALLAEEQLLAEVRETETSLEHRMAEMRRLAEAAVALTSTLQLDEMLQMISDQALVLLGAQVAGAALVSPVDGAMEGVAYSYTAKHAAFATYRSAGPITGAGIHDWMLKRKVVVRLTQEELLAHPGFCNFGPEAGKHPPLRGLLAVPLIGRNGDALGFLQVSDRKTGDFTEQDERLLAHLGRLAAVAVEKGRLHQGVEQAERRLQTQSELLRSITDSMADGLLALDETGRVTFVNQVAEKLLDRREADIRGNCLHDVVHCQEPVVECAAGGCIAMEVLRSGVEQIARETLFVRRDGSFVPVAYSATPVRRQGRVTGAVITFAPIAPKGSGQTWRVAENIPKE